MAWRNELGRDCEVDQPPNFCVDKDGIPHWDGVDARHLRQNRMRATLENETIVGDSDIANERR